VFDKSAKTPKSAPATPDKAPAVGKSQDSVTPEAFTFSTGGTPSAVLSSADSPYRVIVDDGHAVGPGQQHRSAFVEDAAAGIEAAADELLRPVGRTSRDCPYIVHWTAFYRQQSASHIEKFIDRYVKPEGHDLVSVRNALVDRVRGAVAAYVASDGKDVQAPQNIAWLGTTDGIASDPEARNAIQRFPDGNAAVDEDALPASNGLAGGHPLETGLRQRFESSYGRDLSAVRIHTGPEAGTLASSYGARALTYGSEIAFASGQYRPETLRGDLLLAHELAHVVQQNGAEPDPSAPPPEVDPSPVLEGAANRAALRAVYPALDHSVLEQPAVRENAEEHLDTLDLDAPLPNAPLALRRCGPPDDNEIMAGAHEVEGEAPTEIDPAFASSRAPGEVPYAERSKDYRDKEFDIDGDGDQSAELRVKIRGTKFDEKGVSRNLLEAEVELIQLKSKASITKTLNIGGLGKTFPLPRIRQVTDGLNPTIIDLWGGYTNEIATISLYPPPDVAKPTYKLTTDIQRWTGSTDKIHEEFEYAFPSGDTAQFNVFQPESPVAAGVAYGIDMKVGRFGDPFRLTVIYSKILDTPINIGIGPYTKEGSQTEGVNIPSVSGIASVADMHLKIVSNTGPKLVLDIRGDGTEIVEIYDQLKGGEEGGGYLGSDVSTDRGHTFTVRQPATGKSYSLGRFEISEGKIELGYNRARTTEFMPASAAALVNSLGKQPLPLGMEQQVLSLLELRRTAREKALAGTPLLTAYQKLAMDYIDLLLEITKGSVSTATQKTLATSASAYLAEMEKVGGTQTEQIKFNYAQVSSSEDRYKFTGKEVFRIHGAGLPETVTAQPTAVQFETAVLRGWWPVAYPLFAKITAQMDMFAAFELKKTDKTGAEQLEAQIKLSGRLREVQSKNATPVRAVFHPREAFRAAGEIQEIGLLLYYWHDADNWYLADYTDPSKDWLDPYPYNNEEQPPYGLFEKLNYKKHFPKGYLYFTYEYAPGKTTTGRVETTEEKEWSDYLKYAAGAAAIIGVTLFTFGAGTVAVTTAFAVSGLFSAASAAADIVEMAGHGYFDTKEILLDVLQIVTSLASTVAISARAALTIYRGAAAAGKTAAYSASALKVLEWADRMIIPMNITAAAGDVVSFGFMLPGLYKEYQALDKLPEEERLQAKALFLLKVAGTAGLTALSVKGAYAEVRQALLEKKLAIDIINGAPVARYKAGNFTEAEYSAELRARLAGTPAESYSKTKVKIASADDMKKMTTSDAAQATVRNEGGTPVIYVLDGVHPSAFAEEAAHLAQLADPKLRKLFNVLEVTALEKFHTLPIPKRIEMVQAKLVLEIDAQMRVIADIRKTAAVGDAVAFKSLDDAYQNLEHLQGKYIEAVALKPGGVSTAEGALPDVLKDVPGIYSKAVTDTRSLDDAWKHLDETAFLDAYKAKYPDTSLSDVQIKERWADGKRLAPETWRLKDPTRITRPDPKYPSEKVAGSERTYDVTGASHPAKGKPLGFDYQEKKDFDQLFAERDKAAAKAEALSTDPAFATDPVKREAWGKAMAEMREQSRLIGEKVGKKVVEAEFGGKGKLDLLYGGESSRSGDFDLVYRLTDSSKTPPVISYIIVEAKGGSSGLGVRGVGGGEYAEQISRKYFDSIVANMLKGDKKMQDAANELLLADPVKDITALHVKAKIKTDVTAAGAKSSPGPVEVSQFDLSK
jgi:hypothetical protein